MQQTQHTSAQVLLHPACTTNPAAVRAVQKATGRLIVLRGGKPRLASTTLPYQIAFIDECDGPFGGDAA